MPRIKLKPNSPEFSDSDARKASVKRKCDMPGCAEEGVHKAPRDRSLKDYYWFCYEHIQEYNKAWDFFCGMSATEMQDYIYNANIWDRPTQRYDAMGRVDEIKKRAWQTYHFTEEEPPKANTYHHNPHSPQSNTPEFEAMAIMGLAPPITLDGVKTRYKELAKKFHPDLNPDDPEAEERLKKINIAYTVLKIAYKKFEDLPERPS